MNLNPKGIDMDKSRFCTNCGKAIPLIASFCPFCGFPTTDGNFRHVEYQPLEYSPYRTIVTKPTLFRLPIFYIIFWIFASEMGLSIVVGIVIIPFFLSNTSNLPLDSLEFELLLTLIIRVIQVLFLSLIIRKSKNLTNFRPFSQKKDSGLTNDSLNKFNNGFSQFFAFVFVILIFLILDLFETVVFYLLETLKSFFTIEEGYVSVYSRYFANETTLALFFIIGVIIAPVVEELLFRGFLQYSLEKALLPDWAQYFIQATLFALIHLLGDIFGGSSNSFIVVHMLSLFSFSIGATWLRKKFNSVLFPILLHSLGNFFSLGVIIFIDYIPVNFDMDTLEISITVLFVIVTLVLVFFLSITKQWRFSIPFVIKNLKNELKGHLIRASLLMIVFAMIINFFPILYILMAEQTGGFYILALSVFFLILMIIWPRRIIDSNFEELEKNESPEI